jgi:N-carbamoylputrescine amidase
MIDADGSVMGVYREPQIPNAIGYHEKQYFSPGDTGFKVWDTHLEYVGINGSLKLLAVWRCRVLKY